MSAPPLVISTKRSLLFVISRERSESRNLSPTKAAAASGKSSSGTALARLWLVLRLQSPIQNSPPACLFRCLPLSFRGSEAIREICYRGAALLSASRLPPAELRSAAPRYGPSQNLLRHRFAITSIFRAPSPCPLRGWICPPYGSLKALSRSAAPPLSFQAAALSLSFQPSALTVIPTKRPSLSFRPSEARGEI